MRAKEVLGVIECDSSELRGSYESALKINKIGGVCVQGENPTPDNPQEIKKSVVSEIRTHGKNFQRNNHEKETTSNGLTFITHDDGTVTINGTATADTNYNIGGYENPRVSGLYQNLVQISGSFNGEVKHAAFTRTWGDGGTLSINTPKLLKENLVYMYHRMVITTGTVCKNLVVGFVICEDLESSYSYEPYTESVVTLSQPIELYGVGEVQDTIEGGKIVRKYAKEIVNSVTSMDSSGLLAKLKINSTPKHNISVTDSTKMLCDVGSILGLENARKAEYAISIYGNSIYVRNKDVEQTVAGYNAWLASHPITVVYEIAEEVIEDLPLTDQIALSCLKTFHGVTYVEFDGEVQPTLNSEYATNLEGAITLQAQADNKIGKANTLVNRAEGESDVFEVKVEHGLVYLYKDDVLHGILGANNVITNSETYKTMNVRAEEDADFIALTSAKNNNICYYMNINQIPFTSSNFKEAHYFGGDARFTGRVVGNEHIVGKNLQAQQMVFAQAVEASITLISKGDVTAANNIEAQNELKGKDLHFTNMGINGGVAQPVEWVWDGTLERWVLCTVQEQGE